MGNFQDTFDLRYNVNNIYYIKKFRKKELNIQSQNVTTKIYNLILWVLQNYLNKYYTECTLRNKQKHKIKQIEE